MSSEIQEHEINFSSAQAYRKKSVLLKSDIRISDGEETINTIIEGKLERTGVTVKGDTVVTGKKGEEYIIKLEKFPALYEPDPFNLHAYRSKNHGAAVQAKDDLTIMRNDGTKISAKKGDFLFRSAVTNTVNVIDQGTFGVTYGPDKTQNRPRLKPTKPGI